MTDMPDRVQVSYRVPVEVVVNMVTGEVERVVVLDEATSPTVVNDAETFEPVTDEALVGRAYQIAEASVWPAWEFGW